MRTYSKFIVVMLLLAAVSPLAADSLWTAGPTSSVNLCSDLKAYKVGDLLTVLVAEQVTSTLQASTQYAKDQSHSNAGALGPVMTWLPDFGFSSNQDSSASGQQSVANNLATKITATVKGVLPNGNLEIGAEKVLETNGEKQTMTMTATVRPQDVSRNNTVTSTNLANLQVKYSGKGPIGNRQREGVISKLVRFIF